MRSGGAVERIDALRDGQCLPEGGPGVLLVRVEAQSLDWRGPGARNHELDASADNRLADRRRHDVSGHVEPALCAADA
jgi:hypothetical protein